MPDYLKIVIGFLATVATAFLSARWGARSVLKQRWWERKEQAYTEIMEALHNLLRYSSLCAKEYSTGHEHPKRKEFGERYSESYWKIQKMTDIGDFVISDEASGILQKLRDRPQLEWDENPRDEIYEADCAHYREALAGIRVCAKRDLNV